MKKGKLILIILPLILLMAASCVNPQGTVISPEPGTEGAPGATTEPTAAASPGAAKAAATTAPTAVPEEISASPDTGTGGIPTPGNFDTVIRNQYYSWLKEVSLIDPEMSLEVADASLLKFAEALASGGYKDELGKKESYFRAELGRKEETLLIELKLLSKGQYGESDKYDSMYIDDMGEVKLGPSAEF